MSEGLELNSNELRTTRELVHELNSIVSLLEDGSLEKVVVTKSGRPSVVLISIEEAKRLQDLKKNAESP